MKRFYVGLAGLIEKNGRFLVLKRSSEKDFEPGYWEAVTGRLEEEEQPEVGLLREIEEETGITVQILMPIETGFFYRGGKDFPMVFIAFWCQYLSGEVRISWEHSEFKWITLDEALEEPTLGHFHQIFSKIKKLRDIFPEDFSL
ncbi:MAG: NUDIX domain-containing protein [Candidatus Hodarchaeales archaeon]|jgi:8-oxo-dGTP diphosphatase